MNINFSRDTLEKDFFTQLSDLTDLELVFHPIVHANTGHLFGVEARFTGCPGADGETRAGLFDMAREKGLLHQMDLLLRQKVFNEFFPFRGNNRFRLFYRLDHRLYRSPGYQAGSTLAMIEHLGQVPEDICFELHMDSDIIKDNDVIHILDRCRSQKFRTAVANYDIRSYGIRLLDHLAPDYMIFHRDFFCDLKQNPKMQQIMSFMITYSHLMGCRVIARDVRSEDEFTQCREWGCV